MRDPLMSKIVKACEHPIVRAFVIDAITKQADLVSHAKKWPEHCIITLAAWKEAARIATEACGND